MFGELGDKGCDAEDQFVRRQLAGARRGTFDQVGEAEAVSRHGAVVFRFQPGNAESAAGRLAQDGA